MLQRWPTELMSEEPAEGILAHARDLDHIRHEQRSGLVAFEECQDRDHAPIGHCPDMAATPCVLP
jgi:hypothetical protein